MDRSDRRKQSLYFPREMLEEIDAEATRLDRSMSWVIQRAWQAARERLSRMPGAAFPRAPHGKAEA